uniref:Uncharacterized protein n=1 Tax=Plectus sambesii TaxID=2011161 RepID=A0A914WML4_9BILA
MANVLTLLLLVAVICLRESNAQSIEIIGTHIYSDGTVRHNEVITHPNGYAKLNDQYIGNYPYTYQSSESAYPPSSLFYPGSYQYPSNTQYQQQQQTYQYQYPSSQQQNSGYYQYQTQDPLGQFFRNLLGKK